jgi:hypothetical protein
MIYRPVGSRGFATTLLGATVLAALGLHFLAVLMTLPGASVAQEPGEGVPRSLRRSRW